MSERPQRSNVVSTLGKYHLQVTARDAADVVRSAGGWLVDRSMAGWCITVVLTDDCDTAPLRILGVNSRVEQPDDDTAAPLRSLSLAASAQALSHDEHLRAEVLRVLRRGLGEVTVWGDDLGEPIPGVESVHHVLSAAARAFKARALLAIGIAESVDPVEVFRGRTTSLLAGYSDLTPSVARSLAQR
jgi:hypothetical protein